MHPDGKLNPKQIRFPSLSVGEQPLSGVGTKPPALPFPVPLGFLFGVVLLLVSVKERLFLPPPLPFPLPLALAVGAAVWVFEVANGSNMKITSGSFINCLQSLEVLHLASLL